MIYITNTEIIIPKNISGTVFTLTITSPFGTTTIFNEEQVVGTKVKLVAEERICTVEEKNEINIGNTCFVVMHTPGHTKGSMIIYNESENLLFSGDTIFKKSYGRTDLITSSNYDMGNSLNKIFERFDKIFVCPGHGELFELSESKRKIKMLYAFKTE
jgi:glyoxylase-like metal-dependent hydrolase (beta-lactamase superfamily II)